MSEAKVAGYVNVQKQWTCWNNKKICATTQEPQAYEQKVIFLTN